MIFVILCIVIIYNSFLSKLFYDWCILYVHILHVHHICMLRVSFLNNKLKIILKSSTFLIKEKLCKVQKFFNQVFVAY